MNLKDFDQKLKELFDELLDLDTKSTNLILKGGNKGHMTGAKEQFALVVTKLQRTATQCLTDTIARRCWVDVPGDSTAFAAILECKGAFSKIRDHYRALNFSLDHPSPV